MNMWHKKSASKRNPFLPVLITNEGMTKDSYQRLTINFAPGAKTRTAMLEDREHTVIPMVMILEGVHAGSSGPLLYTTEELSKTPQIWNHKPVVVYHPELNGQGISACDPDVVNNRKVGVIMNTRWDAKAKRLPAEAWIEKSRADKIDPRIFKAITNNEIMELSTGLFSDLEQSPGDLNGEKYDGIVRNIRPDHLALLPDKIGACSVAKGAGLLRNEMKSGSMDPKQMIHRLNRFLGITDNESPEDMRTILGSSLRKKFNVTDNTQLWVDSVHSNFAIYELNGKLFRLGYTVSDAAVSLNEESPVEIQIEYRTVDGAKITGNQDQREQTNNDMNKQAMIVAILAANCGWSDKAALEGLSDKQIESIHNGVKPTTPPPPPPVAKVEVPAVVTPTTTTANQEPAKKQTMEEYLRNAPPEISAALTALLANSDSEKASLIEKITANKDSGFSKEDLKDMTVANLKRIAKLGEVPAPQYSQFPPNYSGMAPAGTNNESTEEDVLPTPVMNFKKETAKA